MLPILPTTAAPVANGIELMSWLSPPLALTQLESIIALAGLTFGILAIVVLRHLEDIARYRPQREADRSPPGEPDLPDAA
jgi:hypothetical protein